jgi:hypothetical protein
MIRDSVRIIRVDERDLLPLLRLFIELALVMTITVEDTLRSIGWKYEDMNSQIHWLYSKNPFTVLGRWCGAPGKPVQTKSAENGNC